MYRLPWMDRTGVATTHRDNDIGCSDHFIGERLWEVLG
jgi:hypothetical protein